jgi:hypothetical protein
MKILRLAFLSYLDTVLPRFIFLGFFGVPRLMVSYMGQEILVFVFVDPLNLSLKSKRFSKLDTPFSIM